MRLHLNVPGFKKNTFGILLSYNVRKKERKKFFLPYEYNHSVTEIRVKSKNKVGILLFGKNYLCSSDIKDSTRLIVFFLGITKIWIRLIYNNGNKLDIFIANIFFISTTISPFHLAEDYLVESNQKKS